MKQNNSSKLYYNLNCIDYYDIQRYNLWGKHMESVRLIELWVIELSVWALPAELVMSKLITTILFCGWLIKGKDMGYWIMHTCKPFMSSCMRNELIFFSNT